MINTTEGYLRNACNTRNKQIKTTVKQTMQLMFRDNETIEAKKTSFRLYRAMESHNGTAHCTVHHNSIAVRLKEAIFTFAFVCLCVHA